MNVSFREPMLMEILSDPITQAVMHADSVDLRRLEIMLRNVARERGWSAEIRYIDALLAINSSQACLAPR